MARPINPVRLASPAQSVDGRTTLAKARAPLATDGRNGDFFIDTVAKKLYGPKSSGTWPDNGLIRGAAGWYPLERIVADGAREVVEIYDWAGGEGTKPATGYKTATGALSSTIAEGVDIRGATGPAMLIDGLDAGADTVNFATQVAVADPSGDNEKQALIRLSGPGSKLDVRSTSAAAALTVPASIHSISVWGLGGQLFQRVDGDPGGVTKFRSTDRFLTDGNTDSANGGWWQAAADISDARVAMPATAADGIVSSKLRFDPAGSNAIARTVETMLREILAASILGYLGADPTGASASDAAFNSAFAASDRVLVPPGTWKISETATWARGKRVTLLPGAVISVDSGKTLTIRSAVDIQSEGQVFTGLGTVLGIRQVRPEWFGAERDGTTNDASAFQKAQNCMEAGIASDGPPMLMLLSSGDYGIGAQIVCTPNVASCIAWLGQGSSSGTRLVGLSTFSGGDVLRLKADAVNSSGSAARFEGFRVIPQTAGSGAAVGISIGGDASLTLQGGAHEAILFEDVGVYDFAVCWRYENCRSITTRRCSGWVQTLAGGVSLRITATGASMFTGDLDFYNFQATANATGAAVLDMTATASEVVGPDTLRATVSGVRFHSHIMYTGPGSIIASGGGVIRDIWFTPGWQYDVVKAAGFAIAADGAGSMVRTVKFLYGYYAGGLIGAGIALNTFTIGSGAIFDIDIIGNTFKFPWGDCITQTGVTGLNIRDNKFIDVNGGDLIKFSACFNSIVEGNSIIRETTTGACTNFVVAGAGSNYYSVRSNMTATAYTGAPFIDTAAGAAKIADGNL